MMKEFGVAHGPSKGHSHVSKLDDYALKFIIKKYSPGMKMLISSSLLELTMQLKYGLGEMNN